VSVLTFSYTGGSSHKNSVGQVAVQLMLSGLGKLPAAVLGMCAGISKLPYISLPIAGLPTTLPNPASLASIPVFEGSGPRGLTA